jgi:hypothetical protein
MTLDSNQKFWLLFWLIIMVMVISMASILAFSPFSSTAVEMAKQGYVQKVVIVGDPNNQYTRQVQTVWVKVNDAPIVETK